MSAKSDGLPLPVEPDTVDPEPDPTASYWSDWSGAVGYLRVKPNDRIDSHWFRAGRESGLPVLGLAHPRGHVGGTTWRTPIAQIAAALPPEVVWELVLHLAVVDGRLVRRAKKLTLDGRFVLRAGRFVELAEDAD